MTCDPGPPFCAPFQAALHGCTVPLVPSIPPTLHRAGSSSTPLISIYHVLPSHVSPHCREIQQLLVKIGDKDKSFVGSNKWIGAIEIGYVLDEYLGVTSKVITVNRCGAGCGEGRGDGEGRGGGGTG